MTDDSVARMTGHLARIRDGLPLAYDGEDGARRLLSRASSPKAAARCKPPRRIVVLATAIAAVLGTGVASAATPHSWVHDFFWDVPDKGPHGGLVSKAPSEAPHVLAATVALPHGRHASVYVTSEPDPSEPSCVLVQLTDANGSEGDGIGACGDRPTAAIVWPLNQVLVGTVPDLSVSRVRVTLRGRTMILDVVGQYFAFAPPNSQPAASVVGTGEIAGYDSSGALRGTWPFSLPFQTR